MEAGKLRERVTIEGVTRVPNGQGGFTKGWGTIAERVPASIIMLSGDEALRLGVERSRASYRVVMRKRGGLTTNNKLLWNGESLDIRSVGPDPRDRSALLLMCESGVLG